MSHLLVHTKAPDRDSCVLEVTPESAGWRYVGFAVHALPAGGSLQRVMAERETCLVVLSGKLTVTVGEQVFPSVGSRSSVFDDQAPDAVYIPAGVRMDVVAESDAEFALCSAPSSGQHKARLIPGRTMSVEERGSGTNRRIVRNVLPETEEADSLLIAEVITPAGNWSSYPPHKHDADNLPEESALEETYYHRLNPPQGFAFQRVYTDDRSLDESMAVQDGDCVLVPRGYHPVGAAHGYDLYYLNVMAGPKRTWLINNDPAHEWIVRKKPA